jgi:hypothetical protein
MIRFFTLQSHSSLTPINRAMYLSGIRSKDDGWVFIRYIKNSSAESESLMALYMYKL